MRKLRVHRFKVLFGVLAILGAGLNAWVLTVHLTAMALAGLQTADGGIVICRQGGGKIIVGSSGEADKPKRNSSCPICSGMAALHFGIIDEPSSNLAGVQVSAAIVADTRVSLIADHRLHEVLNRGPPRLA